MVDSLNTILTLAGGAVGLKVLEFGFGLIQKVVESKVEPEQSVQDRVAKMMFDRITELTTEKNDELAARKSAEKERDDWRIKYNQEFEARVKAETKLSLLGHVEAMIDNLQADQSPSEKHHV